MMRANNLTLLAILLLPAALQGQQTVVSTPFQTFSDSYFENFGFNWGYRRMGPRGGLFFNGPGMAGVPFGLGDPNAGARLGFARRGNGSGLFFNMVAQQGSSRVNSVTVPSVTVPNGGQGFISDTIQRPFVTGFVPVVGQQRISPLRQRLERLRQNPSLMQPASRASAKSGQARPDADTVAPLQLGRSAGPRQTNSTATRGDLSVTELKRQRAMRQGAADEEIQALIEKGLGYEQRGKPGVAAIYYKQAARRTDGELQRQLTQRIQAIKPRKSGTAKTD